MATTISDNYGKIDFTIGGTLYSVNKSDIESITLEKRKNRITVNVKPGVLEVGRKVLHLVFSDITDPLHYAIDITFGEIVEFWKETKKSYCRFLTDVGQTEFNTTPRLNLDEGYIVYVDRLFTTLGHIGNGNIVTFTTAMTGNEEIIIKRN